MELNIHLLTSIAVAVVLYPFFGWISVFAVVGGFLIDFDHYMVYVMRTGDWNLRKAVVYYRKRRFAIKRPVLHVFHTVEAFAVLLALSFYFRFFLVIFISYILHMLLDLARTAHYRHWKDRINSVILWFFKRKRHN